MERFWIFLEALAGIIKDDDAIDDLNKELSQMPQDERDRMKKYLQIVAEKIPRFANE